MRGRGQAIAALAVLLLAGGAGVYLQRAVGPRPASALASGVAPSGVWFCPHGGGPSDWEVTLSVANPGSDAVDIRVQDLGTKKPLAPKTYTVGPGTELRLPAAADGRERSSIVEYFGGWVGAGWVAKGGGGEPGVAAEPCLPEAGRRWLLPDGNTERGQDAYAIVMNPFAADAVLTVKLLTEGRRPIITKDWSDYVLPAGRSVAFHLNSKALGERTVSAEVDAAIGRVAAATLGIAADGGGIRSAVGILGSPPGRTVLPSGSDQGRTDLVLMNPSEEKADLGATLEGLGAKQVVGALQDVSQGASSARTYPVSTQAPSTIYLQASSGGVSVAAVRRTFGVNSDEGATGGGIPSSAWVVLPAVAGPPYNPGLVLSNAGPDPAVVTLSYLATVSASSVPAPVTVRIPAGRTVRAPKEFIDAQATAAILALSSEGTFVPAAASYSLGNLGLAGYAVSVGLPISPNWVPQ